MQFIQGDNWHQTYYHTLIGQECNDYAVNFMDVFIDKLDLQESGCSNTILRVKRQLTNFLLSLSGNLTRQLPASERYLLYMCAINAKNDNIA